jgi:hypothetical protein
MQEISAKQTQFSQRRRMGHEATVQNEPNPRLREEIGGASPTLHRAQVRQTNPFDPADK